jgi:hydrogenase expression/formation protein HypC
MCLAIQGQIISINNDKGCIVDFGGITKNVILDLLPEAKVGDFVLVHAGFAIQIIDPDEEKDFWNKILNN